jgi:hypothetical protein
MMNRRFLIYDGTTVLEDGMREVDWSEVRNVRDSELERTDHWALKDRVMSQEKKDYRQALRDLPQDHEEANDAADSWPVMPDA